MREIVLGIERASLKEWLGGGNDGDVYRLKGDPSRAVKIYKYGERQDREEKIRDGSRGKSRTKTFFGRLSIASRHIQFWGISGIFHAFDVRPSGDSAALQS